MLRPMMSPKPLVVVIGCTGVGKTKLSIEVALAIGGEVINADSMQVYKGLNIATNKATIEEMKGVPHHLLDVLEATELMTAIEYRDRALPVIEDIHARGKVPVIVGGTNYYIEALLWKSLADERVRKLADGKNLPLPEAASPYEQLSTLPREQMKCNCLCVGIGIVDPIMANKLHPNDSRKIERALEVYQTFGVPHSQLNVSRDQRELRFPHSILLWPYCPLDALEPRLSKRVDKMMQDGLLLEEMKLFRATQLSTSPLLEERKGVLQVIGFKEFYPLFKKVTAASPVEAILETPAREIAHSVDLTKVATRQYAKKQIGWIKKRLATGDPSIPPLFAFDATHVDQFDQTAVIPAVALCRKLVANDPLPDPLTASTFPVILKECRAAADQTWKGEVKDWKRYHCAVCKDGRIINGEDERKMHAKTRAHKSALAVAKTASAHVVEFVIAEVNASKRIFEDDTESETKACKLGV